MKIQVNLDNDALVEAINYYLKAKVVDVETYNVEMEIISSRSGAGARAEINLVRKPMFAYMDNILGGYPTPVVAVHATDVTVRSLVTTAYDISVDECKPYDDAKTESCDEYPEEETSGTEPVEFLGVPDGLEAIGGSRPSLFGNR